MKTKIMEALLVAATQEGKTSCAVDPSLLEPQTIRNWLTNTLKFEIKNDNVVDWIRGGQK